MTELTTEEELALIRKNRAPSQALQDGLQGLSDTFQAATTPATTAKATPAPAPEAAAPKAATKTPAEIDAELGLPPAETGLAPLPDQDPGFFDVMGAAWRGETIRTDAWNHAAVRRMELVTEMYQMLPERERQTIGREFVKGQGWQKSSKDVVAAVARMAAESPDTAARLASYPQTTDALDQRILSDRIADLDEAEAVLAQPGGGVAEFLGSGLRGMTDETSLLLMPFGVSGSAWRMIAGEAALGALGEAAVLPKEYRVAAELGLPNPDAGARVAMGFLSGGLLSAGIHALGRGYVAFKARTEARRASLAETLPPGVDRIDHEAELDAAEAQLRGDQTVQERLAAPGTTPAGRPSEGTLGDVLGKDAFDWSKHRSQGGLREDAISGLTPEFRTSLEGFIASAPPGIREGLSVFSGFRSIERQQELWDQSDKSGKMVARPGHSKHNHGQAVDIEWNGQRLDKAPPEVQAWVAANLEKFGLTRPMDYEPWHIEPIGARGGKGSGEAVATVLPPVGPDAPPDWARIRNGIFAGESGADFNALFGYQNRRGGKFSHIKPSEMTVDQWLEFQDPNGEYAQWVKAHRPDPENGVATPMGAYQIVGSTLRELKRDLGLKGDEVMTPEFQDYLAQQIYLRQGAGAWQGYKGPRDSYSAGSVDGPAPDMGNTSRGYTGQGQVAVGEDTRIDVNYEVVDYRSLIKASGDLQPRDRTRINSDEWVASTAARLDPAQLMPAPTADRGTPIVGPDNVIESGNGRSMAIARAYERHPDRAAAYRAAIEDAGYTIPDGVEQPVLIARRQTDLSPDQRRQMVIDAQDSGVAQMTPTEVARATARNLGAPILSRLDPTQPLASEANGGFVRAALATLPRSARNAMFDPGGALNALGQRQLREAIFARAWPDPDILARYTEGAPAELKSLMEALETAAPNWAALKADIEAGLVTPDMDIGAYVLDAMRLIGAARELAQKQGMPIAKAVAELVDEIDLIEGPISPLTARLVRKMWKGGRAAPADEVAAFLTRYADEARKAGQAGGMFDAPGPRDVLRTIDPVTFGDLPEDFGQARGFATRPTSEAPAEAVRELPDQGFDQGARSPEAEAVHAEIEASLRPEPIPSDTMPAMRPAATFSEARQAVSEFQGRALRNEATGIEATVSRNALDKMLSRSAVDKSTSAALHSRAVANIDALFAASRLGWSKADRAGDTNIAAIHRYFVPMRTAEGKPSLVKMTVKEDARKGRQNPLYTIEAVEFLEGSSADKWVDAAAAADNGTPPKAIRPAEDVLNMARDVDDFNRLAAARADLGEFADIEIDLPDGTTARAGDILDDLDADRAADAVVQACATSSNGAAQ